MDNNNHNYTIFGKILIMILSFIPGCGHMYMGLMKRGMFILISFFSCSYLATSVFYRVFIIGFIIIWLFGIFDAYNCRKKLGEGKILADDINDIKKFLMKYRKIIIALFGIISVIETARGLLFVEKINLSVDDFPNKEFFFDNVMIFLLICVGLYCLFFRKKK